MTRKGRRLVMIGVSGLVLVAALALVLVAMRDTIVFFRAPSEVVASGPVGTRIRLGGLVEAGSVRRNPDQVAEFAVEDGGARVPVRYKGILPDLFREGQGVVAEGVLTASGTFMADTVLARHDETYMPREVVDALKAQGRWQEGSGLRQTTQR
ncbi:cytochrome c maturation protein CcmE [Enterovirga sp.]|jgi:cytochrome c-type biogenesis protein CcmE|uniref:cytochrome c maturation protein CcmE n=1 Tax=Enterovirga sp. TaxID=2026350 RepID=UPI00260B25E0|nr:cytochrome c maturation protein CcmE [Enterovirga sp.]MDB5590967.1 ccmE [Enterovirga sp.]